MRTSSSKYLVIFVPLVGMSVLAACTDSTATPSDAGIDSASPAPTSTTPVDPPVPDASVTDASTEADASTLLSCSGGGPLSILGYWVASDGTQHWLKQTSTALSYSRIPSGPAMSAKPPTLWKITQVCSDAKFFVAVSEASTYARVDWAEDGAGPKLCIAVEGAADVKSLLAEPLSVPASATGCKGGAWIVLSKKDGGQ